MSNPFAVPSKSGGSSNRLSSSSGGGGSNPFAGGTPSVRRPEPKKKGRGFLGTIAHIPSSVGHDIASLAGVPVGLYHTAEALGEVQRGRPEKAITLGKGTAAATKEELQHPLRHPLYTALDVLTLASLGAGGAVRAGLLPAERVALETRSVRAFKQGGEGPVDVRLSSTRPLVRGRQRAFKGAQRRISEIEVGGRSGYNLPLVGEGATYARGIRHGATVKGLQELPAYERYRKLREKLSAEEKQALAIIPRDVHPDDLAEALRGTPNAEIAANPKVAALVLSPSKRLARAEAAQRELSVQGERIFQELGFLGEESAATRPGRYREIVSTNLGKEARALHGQPYYVPDLTTPAKRTSPLAGSGGGIGLPKAPGTAKLNKGINAELGRIDFSNDLPGPEYLRRVHLKTHTAVYNGLRSSAIKLSKEDLDHFLVNRQPPKGWEFLRAPVVGKQGGLRAQRLPYTLKEEGTARVTPQELREAIPDPADATKGSLSEHLGTNILEKAYYDGQFYYVAPSKQIKSAAGQFTRSSTAVRRLIENPLTVWRALVLGLRPGFLTNNVVGNNLLYAFATAGTGGLRAYLHALEESGAGKKVIRKLINEDFVPRGVTTELMDEFFPEQVHGTFGRTQSPAESPIRGKAASAARKVGAGIIPATSAIAETLPRRALVENMLRRSPEFKDVYRSVPKQARKFDIVARKTLRQRGPEYQRLISEQVNNALGDYVGLSAVERNVIRNVIPFYSWYRAIATIAYHMAVDTPGRALILTRLGEIGREDTERTFGKLPQWLQGIIPIGERQGDIQQVLSTGGLNPYATLPQVGSGFTEDIQGLGLAPYISVPAYVLAHSYGQPTSLKDILAQSAYSFGRNLPPSRVIKPLPPSKLYPKRGRKSEILSYLGIPLKELNVPEANRRAER